MHADVSQDIIIKGLFLLHSAHATVSFYDKHNRIHLSDRGKKLNSVLYGLYFWPVTISQTHVVPFFTLPHVISENVE